MMIITKRLYLRMCDWCDVLVGISNGWLTHKSISRVSHIMIIKYGTGFMTKQALVIRKELNNTRKVKIYLIIKWLRFYLEFIAAAIDYIIAQKSMKTSNQDVDVITKPKS